MNLSLIPGIGAMNRGGGGGGGGGGGSSLAPYLGLVATRNVVPQYNLTQSNLMSRAGMVAVENLTSYRIDLANWYTNAGAIANGGQAVTYKCSIEYPAGTCTPITWNSGAASVTVPAGANAGLSDPITVAIPAGAMFWFRCFATGPGPNIPATGNYASAVYGDSAISNGTATDLTGGGTVSGSLSWIIHPLCLVQTTTRPSFGFMGDSRSILGIDGSGNFGLFQSSIVNTYAWGSYGQIGGRVRTLLAGNQIERDLHVYASHIIHGMGINDFETAGSTDLQLRADMRAAVETMPGKVHMISTCAPYTTSTDSWTTLVNQTVKPFEAERVSFNTWVKTTPFPFQSFMDVNAALESGTSGRWNVPGFTSDGLHQTSAGNAAIVSSGAVAPATNAARLPTRYWTPYKNTKTVDWFDAANPRTSTGNNNVTQVVSGTGMNGGGSVLDPVGFNGGPGYTQSGSGSGQLIFTSATLQNQTGAYMGIMWQAGPALSAQTNILGYTINGSFSTQRAMIVVDTSNRPGLAMRRLDTDATVTAFSSTPLVNGQRYLLVATFDPSTGVAKLSVDGVVVATASFGTTGAFDNTASNGFLVGYSNPGTGLVGTWRECVGFASPVSDAERQKLEGWLAWRAGLNASNLLGGHPWASTRPTL